MSATNSLAKAACRHLGESIAYKLLRQPDQRWQQIDLRYTIDPAEYLQVREKT